MSVRTRVRETTPRLPERLAAAVARVPFVVQVGTILLLETLLSLWRLQGADLALDEGISYWIARKPLLDVIAYSLSRAWEHPPLYYILLHAWMSLAGDSEFALRAFSWVGLTLAVTVLVSLSRRWCGKHFALIVGIIAATNPMLIKHGRDARMYPWLMMLIPLSVYALDRALRSNRWRDWALFVLAMGLAIGMHYLISLVLFCYVVFVAIQWRKLPTGSRKRFVQILGVLFVAGVALFTLFPGPRSSVAEGVNLFLQMKHSFGPLWDVYSEWAIGTNAASLPLPVVVMLTLFVAALVVAGIGWLDRVPRRTPLDLRWLLGLLIVVPSAIAVFVMPFSSARHTSASIGLALVAAAFGVAAAWRRSRALGAGLLVALIALNLGMSIRHIASGQRPFAVVMDYVNARARDGEPVVYTYYFDWPFDSYYNRRGLPYYNAVVERHQEISEELAQVRAAEVVGTGAPSFWLMLFPGPENTDRVERAFNALAFPGERIWFPSGRSVIRYFSAKPLSPQAGAVQWGDAIGLSGWAASGSLQTGTLPSLEVSAGDALRLQFQWQLLGKVPTHYLRTINLVGPDGAVWGKFVSEPCNGRCPTSSWDGRPVEDRLAFQIPPDVPPGDYRMQVEWLTDQGTALAARSSNSAAEATPDLATVHVTPPQSPSPYAPPFDKTIDATVRPGLSLRSSGFGGVTTRAGGTLTFPLQWAVSEPQPGLDLLLSIRGPATASLTQPLGPVWHPSSDWQPPRMIATQTRFTLPGNLRPGEYSVAVGVVAAGEVPQSQAQISLGRLVIEDRPRSFTLPSGGEPADASCDEAVRLARFSLPQDALPGTTVPITLTWQAGGPTSRNWKVFIHVLDAAGKQQTQSDGYPLEGQASTLSWQAREVLVDVHPVALPADLQPGDYTIRLGLYDEPTGERLRCGGADVITLPKPLVVHAR